MTRTIQTRSYVTLNKADKGVTAQNPETEDNRSLLLAVFDSLNTLYEKLNRLNYVIQRRSIERILYPKGKEKRDED